MTTNVLILCTHNSARSVLSEGMLNHWARALGKDVKAFSAGSAPSGRINPYALEALGNAGVDVSDVRSKSWDEFTALGAPEMRIVITVCDSAAAEQCPYWPGGPVKVHWGYPDPSNAPEAEKKQAFIRSLRGTRTSTRIGPPSPRWQTSSSLRKFRWMFSLTADTKG